MSKSSLKGRLARLGPIRAVDRDIGLPVDLVLRPKTDGGRIEAISATLALTRRGLSMLRAKRTVETIVEMGEAVVHLPAVTVLADLVRELQKAGIAARRLAHGSVDVRAARLALGMTQEQFALRFGFDLDALQNWEQGRRTPDKAIASYLRVIERLPREAALAQEEEPA
jgi:DNA-binding transcriptional regulator YiaG